jgi:hypothetical protein
MPPRFVYWTILIDGKPTAFRARDRQELQTTFSQLKRTNEDVVIRWFARGRLWDSPEAERAAEQRPKPVGEKRGKDWRPGGAHKDPRDRFKKKNRPERAWSENDDTARRDRERLGPPKESRPWRDARVGVPRGAPSGPSRSNRSWSGKPSTSGAAGRRPWSGKPRGAAFIPRAKPPYRKRRDDDPEKS